MTSRPYREIQLDPSCISAVPVSIPSARVQRQVLSQDQWEDLKPIIRRLYIEENQTFPKICTILSSTHGFTPTKRQFNSKINRWGFRKNATKEERRRIAQSSNGQTTLGANGKAISQKIRKRWEKEFRPVNGEDLQISRGMFSPWPRKIICIKLIQRYIRCWFEQISSTSNTRTIKFC